MKKKLFILVFALVALFQFNIVKAAEPVPFYFFYRDSCPFCVQFKEFLDNEFDATYKAKINMQIIDVETNTQNQQLMRTVTEILDTNSGGAVPFVVIGKNPILGFGGTAAEIAELKEFIREEYEKPVTDRFDIMENLDFTPEPPSSPNDNTLETSELVTVLIMIAVLGGVFCLLFFTKDKKKK